MPVSAPTVITVGPTDVTLAARRHRRLVMFHCLVSSDPSTPVNLVWFRGDHPVVTDGRRLFISAVDRSLVVNVTDDDEDNGLALVGRYSCRATNGLTADSREVRLRPPLAPSLVGASDDRNMTRIVEEQWTLFGLTIGQKTWSITL